MTSILKSLRMLADPSRTRIVVLLEQEELSVAELQEVLGMGQSTLSTHLAQLKRAGIVEDRRAGKNILYRLKEPVGTEKRAHDPMMCLLRQASGEFPRPTRTGTPSS
jgi:DNA-binding transcriptional ArsR family regulator